jgi:hypothetical protein
MRKRKEANFCSKACLESYLGETSGQALNIIMKKGCWG